MIKREDLIKALKQVKVDNGPSDNTKLDKDALIKEFKDKFTPKISEKSEHLQEETPSKDLSNTLMMKNEWKPKTSIKELTQRVHIEAVSERNKPNVFRLNIETLVLDKIHSKFKINRGPSFALVEILYPNANSKISLKFQVEGVEDRIIEVGLEDEAYTRNFGIFIIRVVDEMLKHKQQINPRMDDLDAVNGVIGQTYTAPSTGVTGQYPMWESIMSLVEADEPELDSEATDDAGVKAPTDFPNGVGGEGENAPDTTKDAGDVNAEDGGFGADDFSLDKGSPEGDSGLGDLGGAMGGGDFGGGSNAPMDVNKTGSGEQSGTSEAAPEYSKFRDKTDWENPSLIGMQKLVATDASKKMQSGSGVVLTSDEVINGTAGIKGDNNYDIVNKFLKIYPELDNMDIPVDMVEQIEDKLALNDDQFDSWLQAKLPEITGSQEVDETLDNEMFEDFKPMGGEKVTPPLPISPSGVPTDAGLPEFLKSLKSDEENTENTTLRNVAEREIGGNKLNEFPNATEGGEPTPKVKPEEKKP